MKKRILIISASIGGGHVAAANALMQAFELSEKQHLFDVEHIDILNFTYSGFRRLYRDAYFDLVKNVPDFVDWFGKRLENQHTGRRQKLLSRLSRVSSRKLAKHIAKNPPDLIIHTHFLAPALLNPSKHNHIPQVSVITDYGAHSIWRHDGIDCYFAACEEIKAHLLSLGVPKTSIQVLGIPIAQGFTQLPTREEAKKRLGYQHDLLLFNASGMKAETVKILLAQLCQLDLTIDVIVASGRSPDLQRIVTQTLASYEGKVRFEVLGFTTELPKIMCAANLMIGKPGGLTTSEALAAALPFAVVNPYPLQEEANANFLIEGGAGIRIEPLSVFSYKLQSFLNDSERQLKMADAARTLAKPHAANLIRDFLLENYI